VSPPFRPGDRVSIHTAYGDVPGTVQDLYLPGPPRVYVVEVEWFPRLLVPEALLLPAGVRADAPHAVTATG